MMACDDRIAALVDAASGEPAGPALTAHLASCPGCTAELRNMQQTESVLRATAKVPDDLHLSGFAYRVADRAEAFRDRSPRGLWWSFTRGARLAMTFSASALVASMALFVAARSPGPARTVATPAAAVPVLADESESWEEYIPEAMRSIDDDEDSSEDTGSLDLGLENLSADEMDTLAQTIDQPTPG